MSQLEMRRPASRSWKKAVMSALAWREALVRALTNALDGDRPAKRVGGAEKLAGSPEIPLAAVGEGQDHRAGGKMHLEVELDNAGRLEQQGGTLLQGELRPQARERPLTLDDEFDESPDLGASAQPVESAGKLAGEKIQSKTGLGGDLLGGRPASELPLETALEIMRTKVMQPVIDEGVPPGVRLSLTGAADQLTKTWAVAALPDNDIVVIEGFLEFRGQRRVDLAKLGFELLPAVGEQVGDLGGALQVK